MELPAERFQSAVDRREFVVALPFEVGDQSGLVSISYDPPDEIKYALCSQNEERRIRAMLAVMTEIGTVIEEQYPAMRVTASR
jgi:hypothetical protein